jgi:hypothetical protein
MAPIDNLPADQRAVLELVLRRGRSYDEIARLLSIDRAGVRQRALAAFDALGPKTRVAADRRALITDYLLSALPGEVAGEVRDHLESSAGERAWARAIASELQELSDGPLPEIPSNGSVPQAKGGRSKSAGRAKTAASHKPAAEVPPAVAMSNGSPRLQHSGRPVSRVGGAVLLGVAAVVAIVLVLVLVVFNGSDNHKHPALAAHGSTTAAHSTSAASSAKLVSKITLTPPAGGRSPVGLAEVISLQGKTGVAIAAQGLAANRKSPPNDYAVWLYNSPTSSEIVGFAAAVTSNGLLRTAGALPTDASKYHELLITLETTAKPKTPGTVVLEGSGKL